MLIFSMIEVSLPEDQYNVNSQCSECSQAGGMSIPFSGTLLDIRHFITCYKVRLGEYTKQ